MSPISKSKNIENYLYFLNFEDPSMIPFKDLGLQLRVHPNRLRGMIRSAKHNHQIYISIRQKGIRDSQIPQWFIRPEKYYLNTTANPIRHETNAIDNIIYTPSTTPPAEDRRSYIRSGQTPSSQSFSPINWGSSPSPESPQYNISLSTPLSPLMQEMAQDFRDQQEEYWRERLEESKKRRTPPQDSFEVSLAKIEANAMLQKLRSQSEMNFLFWNLLNNNRKRPDVKDTLDSLTESKDETNQKKDAQKKPDPTVELIKSMAELFKPSPPFSIPNDFQSKVMASNKEKNKRDLEAIRHFCEIMKERRENEKYARELTQIKPWWLCARTGVFSYAGRS